MQVKDEALRYLGYKNQDIPSQIMELLNDCLSEIKLSVKPRVIKKKFYVSDKISSSVLIGNSIKKHLLGCSSYYLIAVTLGQAIDQKIKYYQYTDLAKCTIFDACCSAYIEKVCEDISNNIETIEGRENRYITTRFSPGYGDLPLLTQGKIVDVLQTHKNIGLSCNKFFLLVPRKSVTAIIGVSNSCIMSSKSKCELCNLEYCSLRN